MKKLITIQLFLSMGLLYAQKKVNKECGIYLDSVKVEVVTNCNFSTLHAVLPFDFKTDSIPFFNIWVKYSELNENGQGDSCVFFIPKPILFKEYVKGEFIIVKIFDKKEEKTEMSPRFYSTSNSVEVCTINYRMFCESLQKSKSKILSIRIEALDIAMNGRGKYKTATMEYNLSPLTKTFNYKCVYSANSEVLNKKSSPILSDIILK